MLWSGGIRRETSVADVRAYVGRLRGMAGGDDVAIGHGQLDERDRVLLSIAERAGAVELQPGGPEGLLRAKQAYARVARAISSFEPVIMAASSERTKS